MDAIELANLAYEQLGSGSVRFSQRLSSTSLWSRRGLLRVPAAFAGRESHRVRKVHDREFGGIDHSGDLGDVAVGDGVDDEGKRGAVFAPGDDAGAAVDDRRVSLCRAAGHSRAGGDFVAPSVTNWPFGVWTVNCTSRWRTSSSCSNRPSRAAARKACPTLTLFSSGACRLLGGLYLPAGAAGEHFCRVGGFSENGVDLREELVTRCC